MMNVLIITRAKLSLSRAHSMNILKTAEYLGRISGVEVRVVSCAAEPREAAPLLADKGITKLDLDVTSRRRSVWWYLMQASSYDVVYFRDPWLIFPAFFVRLIRGKKIVFEVHGSHEWRFLLPLWLFAVHMSDGAVFITGKLAQYYRTPLYVIAPTNAVELEEYQHGAGRKKLGLPEDVPLIMYVGSFLWYSFEILLEMMSHLAQHHAILVLVGPTAAEQAQITAQAKKMGIEDRCIIIQRIIPKLVPQYLLVADVLVNPLATAYPGSVSSKLYEYLAAGKPIVSTYGGANEEVISDGVNGLLVREARGETFAKAVERILADPVLAHRLGEAARASASQYSWEARAERIGGLLKKVI
jgi:glycosyltransferase involved in cell wall biosynthesis